MTSNLGRTITQTLTMTTNQTLTTTQTSRTTMAEPSFSPDDLRRGLETLPQELYDMIYFATFAAPPKFRDLLDIVEVRHNLKLLQISSTTRKLYAEGYYGHNAPFKIYGDIPIEVKDWLRSLPEPHRALLHRIHIVPRAPYAPLWPETVRQKKFILSARTRGCRLSVQNEFGEALAAKVFTEYKGMLYEGQGMCSDRGRSTSMLCF